MDLAIGTLAPYPRRFCWSVLRENVLDCGRCVFEIPRRDSNGNRNIGRNDLHQQVRLPCYVVFSSNYDFYVVLSPSASVTWMLCRLHQQVWLLWCVVSIIKRVFYAAPSPSATWSVTSILYRLHANVTFYAVSSSSANVTSMLCSLHQQVWLRYGVVSISKCDIYGMSSPSASVTSMLYHLRQQEWRLCYTISISILVRGAVSVQFIFNTVSSRYGACAHYVIVSKIQWKPFWLATQNRMNYDLFAQAPLARMSSVPCRFQQQDWCVFYAMSCLSWMFFFPCGVVQGAIIWW